MNLYHAISQWFSSALQSDKSTKDPTNLTTTALYIQKNTLPTKACEKKKIIRLALKIVHHFADLYNYHPAKNFTVMGLQLLHMSIHHRFLS